MTRREIIFGLAVTLLLAFGSWYLVLRTSGFAKDATEDKRLQIVKLYAESSDSPQTINVLGQTSVPSRVRLKLKRNQEPYSDWQTTQGDGSFSFKGVIVEPGDTNIKLDARTTIGLRALETSKELNVWLTPTVLLGTVLANNGAPPSKIKILLINSSAEAGSWFTSISNGKFVLPDLIPGEYKLTIWAPQSTLYERDVKLVAGQSLDIGEVRLVKGDSPEPVISGAKPITRRRDDEQVLAFDSTRSPKLSGRTVTANVSYRQLVMRLDTTLSYDDKRLGILLGRDNVIPPESRESQFIKQVFSDFRIQGHGLNEFQWKFDRKCEKGLCPVQATSEPVQIGFARTLNQQWKVTTDWRSQNDNDTFVLKLTDYQLEDADTPDMSSSAAKWTIEGKDTAINFKLKYDLSDTVGLIRVFTAPIDRLTSWQFSSLNRFLYGFLLAILLLWMLWFFEIFSVLTRIRKHFTPAAKWLLLFGISIAFLPAFYYAVQFTTSSLTLRSNKPTPCTNPTLCSLNPLQCTTPTPNLFQRVFMHFVDRCIFESGNDLRLLVITSCLVATAVVVLMVIGHLLLRRGAIAVWSKATLKGIAVAGFFYVAFVLFVGFAQRS